MFDLHEGYKKNMPNNPDGCQTVHQGNLDIGWKEAKFKFKKLGERPLKLVVKKRESKAEGKVDFSSRAPKAKQKK